MVISGSAGFLQVIEMKDRFLKQLLSSKWSKGGVRWERMWRMVGVREHKNQSKHHCKHHTRCKVTQSVPMLCFYAVVERLFVSHN